MARQQVLIHDGVVLTQTTFVLERPLDELDDRTRCAVSGWLTEHGIQPDRVVVGTKVERHEHSHSVAWRERGTDGIVVHHWFPPVASTALWPAPFPGELLGAIDTSATS